MKGHGYVTLPSRQVGAVRQPVLRGRRATAPSTPWGLGVRVPSPLGT